MIRAIIPFLIVSFVHGQDELPISQFSPFAGIKEESAVPFWDLLPYEMKELVVFYIKLPDLSIVELVSKECQHLVIKEREKRYTQPIRLSFFDPQKAPISDLLALEIKLKNEKGELWKSYVFPYAQNTRLVPLGCSEDFSIKLPYEVLPLRVTVDFIAGYLDKDEEIFASWREPINIGKLRSQEIFYKDAEGNKKTAEAIRFTPQNILFKRLK
ncbi:MAG: hypothetical protein K0M45_10220 [Candidatus Paracaedibacteraceae bacterium]|nr:hypothetical protein [Candidatus Paracaedibacteraceae bacterium]